jgi:hypothetical protein
LPIVRVFALRLMNFVGQAQNQRWMLRIEARGA